MPKFSAGLLPYRISNNKLEIFLVHPGGPYWSKKDQGVWSIPKGEYNSQEDPKTAARREFIEETGLKVPINQWLKLDNVSYADKIVTAWAVEADLDPTKIKSNYFEIEWPPRSGKKQSFPEVDRAGWFEIGLAKQKILAGQKPLLDNLEKLIKL